MLEVNGEGLDTTVTRLETQIAAVKSELDALDSRSRVLESQWSGDARVAYAQARRDWESEFVELNGMLNAVKDAVRTAHDRYEAAERRVAASWEV